MPVEGPLERLVETDRRSTAEEARAAAAAESLKAKALTDLQTLRKNRLDQESAKSEAAFAAEKRSLLEKQDRILLDYQTGLDNQKKDLAGFESLVRRTLAGGG